jgi:hypothetical protein
MLSIRNHPATSVTDTNSYTSTSSNMCFSLLHIIIEASKSRIAEKKSKCTFLYLIINFRELLWSAKYPKHIYMYEIFFSILTSKNSGLKRKQTIITSFFHLNFNTILAMYSRLCVGVEGCIFWLERLLIDTISIYSSVNND